MNWKAKITSRYGLKLFEYQELLHKQHGVCAICQKGQGDRRLAVDHEHVTGKVRGLLCSRCNRSIGAFEDNQTLLLRAAAYLGGVK